MGGGGWQWWRRKNSENHAERRGAKKNGYLGSGQVQKTGIGALKRTTSTCDTEGAWSLACALMGNPSYMSMKSHVSLLPVIMETTPFGR